MAQRPIIRVLLGLATVWSVDAALSTPTAPPGYQIRTFAGTGEPGDAGDGGPATSATLSDPNGVSVVTLARGGALYIADAGNDVVRRVDLGSGLITAFASAKRPTDVAASAAGDVVYVAGHDENRVLRVRTADGFIDALAGTGVAGFSGDGGPASLAQLAAPRGVALDGVARVVFTDASNQRVRAVDLVTGIIYTVAGIGVAGYSGEGGPATANALNNPSGVAISGNGDVVVADSGNNRVRIISASAGTIHALVGSGAQAFAGDGGPATAAALNSPVRVAFDGDGNLLIADLENHRVRAVSAVTGVITTIGGTGAASVSGDGGDATSAAIFHPFGLCVDAYGAMYVGTESDGSVKSTNRIRVLVPRKSESQTATRTGSSSQTPSQTASPSHTPSQTASPSQTPSASASASFSPSPSSTPEPPSARYTIGTVAGDGEQGSAGDGSSALNASFYLPSASAPVTTVKSTQLLIADTGNNAMRRVDLSTGVVTALAAAVWPTDVAANSAGTVAYVTCFYEGRVRAIVVADGVVTTLAGSGAKGFSGDGGPATSASLNGPYGVAVDGAARVLFTDSTNQRVRAIDLATGIIYTLAGMGKKGFSGDGGPAAAAALSNPSGVGVGVGGDIFIADSENQRIRFIPVGTGIIYTLAGTGNAGFSGDGGPAAAAVLNNPLRVAVAENGDVLIADSANHRVRRVTAATGRIYTVAGNGAAGFSGDGGDATSAALDTPTGLAFDATTGTVYVGDQHNQRVRALTLGK